MQAYTDYPIADGTQIVREVTVLTWDRNKYCLVEFGNIRYEIKVGYLYTDNLLTVSAFDLISKLPRCVGHRFNWSTEHSDNTRI